jgi:hypothetical protein
MGRGGAGGLPPPFAETLLVSPKKAEIPAGVFANRVAVAGPNPSASWFRYIYRNPLKAGLVETLDDYPWSRQS